jgi:hypothetical protein
MPAALREREQQLPGCFCRQWLLVQLLRCRGQSTILAR